MIYEDNFIKLIYMIKCMLLKWWLISLHSHILGIFLSPDRPVFD